MKTTPQKTLVRLTLAGAIALPLFGGSAFAAPPLPGAIFTTTVDGSIVNENVHYEAKEDVYLDGGPGPNAPSTAAGLPEGDYYFQVTDPSGKDLLSTDHISCRRIHVNASGVIDSVYPGTNYVYSNKDKDWKSESCQHNQGTDVDHAELGAITVQLFPYDDTPNKGGVYKVWVTPVGDYAGNTDAPVDKDDAVNGENYQPANYHGFIPAKSKTDNYKVRRKGAGGPGPYPVDISVRKFADSNLNGVQDEDEADVIGWAVDVTDDLGVINTVYTPTLIVAATPGTYTFVEEAPSGTLQTVGILDGVTQSLYPAADPTVLVDVQGASGETHEVVYGNIGLGQIEACKIYDRNGDGVVDADEPGISGWKIQLSGTDILGDGVGPLVQVTGADGCTTFADLLPGDYTVTELIPATGGWVATGPTSATVTIESGVVGGDLAATFAEVDFTNICLSVADFGTKGYWHNKNGLTEMTQADIDYVNSLLPYSSPSSYFDAGDEPFDGFFTDGTPVDAAIGDGTWAGVAIAPAGTPKAEVSQFLVDKNANGDPREQLAQQLLAFIFNAIHALDAPGAAVRLSDGTYVSAQGLIDAAIDAWATGTAEEQTAIKDVLDWLNNSDELSFIPFYPCPIVYP